MFNFVGAYRLGHFRWDGFGIAVWAGWLNVKCLVPEGSMLLFAVWVYGDVFGTCRYLGVTVFSLLALFSAYFEVGVLSLAG